ncbi:MFS transporter [Paeniglutamicibacter cryotolerans]|uniref:MHS family proline/betaine transporter-like MFS transporter n=1 Tax=Paeniglutamicibacter cryotolerans TaxID=670079 RepID=A0A839QIF9_9MICC|nr:MFS transporter [Paeniglutamicibacter cryotolerans]MBB2995567.1 MHS family proline/betaine transporter-like MFS transporter [Paeniglutamicibacter cryotolerans]
MQTKTQHTEPEPGVISGQKPSSGMQKRVLAGGSIGQFIEFYDFTLYGLSAVVLSQLFFPGSSPLAGLLATFATFGVAFLVRPLGGLFFGALGDRVGRRKVLFITLLSIGTATALIGVLPTHATIGAAAPVLLVLCRMVQGFSAGGESVGAPAFVFEHAPIEKRGFWLNLTLAATALPSVFGGTLILILSGSMSSEAFMSWGWRIPFLIALPMAFFGLWIRAKTEESEAFKAVLAKESTKEYSPIRQAFTENKVRMLQVIFVMGLTAMGFYFLSGYFVSYVQVTGNLSREHSLLANAAAMLLYAILLPIGGIIGDKVGRKPMLIAGSAALALLAIPCFMLVTSGSLPLAIAGQLLFVVPMCIYGGGAYTFFVEIFTTRTRFTSAAISYNVAYAIFGGSAPFIGTFLVAQTGLSAAPGYYMAAAAVIVFLLLTLTKVPETRRRIG